MLIALSMGILSAVSLVIVMSRFNLKRCMGYPVAVDVTGTILFCILFAGTITGMMVAVVAGLALSGIVWLVRTVMGFERWDRKSGWVYYPPRYMTA